MHPLLREASALSQKEGLLNYLKVFTSLFKHGLHVFQVFHAVPLIHACRRPPAAAARRGRK